MLDTAFTGKLIIALCAAGNWNLKKQTKREILIRVMKMENEIEYLRAKIAVLKLELNRVRAERDAAIADLAQIESTLQKYQNHNRPCCVCAHQKSGCVNRNGHCRGFKWRGIEIKNQSK